MHWYTDVWKKYADFSGRARRSEYWYFTLFNAIVLIVLLVLGMALTGFSTTGSKSVVADIPYFIYILASLLPSLAVSVRRLHDTGKNGWMLLLGLIPLVGPIILLVFFCTDSEFTTNQYGPNPKAVGSLVP